jgi:4-hydroxy-tetrahydrodipicolinate synthase
MDVKWEGIYPAITTQFSSGGELDLKMFEINLQAQLDDGIYGIILGGTVGVSRVLSFEDIVRFL